ncbi:MAG: hypothetical protein Q4C46_08105 [Bacillota bacterium]|nr:hypothetical protein [Bacillota bacterium]
MKGQQRYLYPGGNTPQGFYSYYNYILSQKEAEKIFCIKGGPGVGKSTMMKHIGEHFLEKGENVDFFRCSSDPGSIDGVLIKTRAVAVIDATAPHIIDPRNPGAVDVILNLGDLLNVNKLKKHRLEIVDSGERTSAYFKMAYHYLRCASSNYDFMSAIFNELICEEKTAEIIAALLDEINKAAGMEREHGRGRRRKFFACAVTPAGVINEIESIATGVEKIIRVEAPDGFGNQRVLKPLSDELIKAGHDIEEYYCSMDPDNRLEHIIIPEYGIALFTCNSYHGVSDMRKEKDFSNYIIDVDAYGKDIVNDILEDQKKSAAANIAKAVKMLKNAKLQHDMLERYYIEAMSFNKLKKMEEAVIKEIEQIKLSI